MTGTQGQLTSSALSLNHRGKAERGRVDAGEAEYVAHKRCHGRLEAIRPQDLHQQKLPKGAQLLLEPCREAGLRGTAAGPRSPHPRVSEPSHKGKYEIDYVSKVRCACRCHPFEKAMGIKDGVECWQRGTLSLLGQDVHNPLCQRFPETNSV